MSVQAVVEICRQPNGALPIDLIRTAYAASYRGTIVLALRQVAATAVDKELDKLVQELPLNLPGVLYIEADNYPLLTQAIASAAAIFFATDIFKTLVCKMNLEEKLR